MKNLSFLAFAFLLIISPSFLYGQSLRRENKEKESVELGKELLSFDNDEIVPWHWNERKEEWNNEGVDFWGIGSKCNAGVETAKIEKLSVHNIVVNGDTNTILFTKYMTGSYKYPNIKKEWRSYEAMEWIVFDGNEKRREILQAIQTLDTVTATDFAGQVQQFTFNYFAYKLTLSALGTDRIAEEIQTRSTAPLKRRLALSIFPVKIDGKKSIRFIPLYQMEIGDEFYEVNVKPVCFDEGYYEMEYDDFRKMIEAFH